MNSSRLIKATVAVAIALLPATASACSACMGDSESDTAAAINAAMFVMLGCIFSMLGLLVAFGIYLARRANAPLPPHIEFIQDAAQAE